LLSQLATKIIEEARISAANQPSDHPVTLALEITYARIGAWFARAGNDRDRTADTSVPVRQPPPDGGRAGAPPPLLRMI
jgi:hypothetical protein